MSTADERNETPSPGKRHKRLITINYVCICFYAFLTGTDFAVIIPTLWDRLHQDYQASGTFMGLVISAYSTTGVISGLLMGKLSDHKSSRTKPFYIVSVLLSICGHLLYFVGINKYVILLARAVSGLCMGASTVALAYIAKTSSQQARTGLISLVMASRQLGLMLGPAFNIFLRKTDFTLLDLIEVNRKSSPGLFMALIWTLILILFIFIYRDFDASQPVGDEQDFIQKPEIKETWQNNCGKFLRIEICVLLATTFFTYFNQTSLETALIPFTEDVFGWNELHNSVLFCVGGCIIILSYVLIRFLTMKFNDRFILLMGVLGILIGLVIGLSCVPFVERNQLSTLNGSATNNTGQVLDVKLKFAFAFFFLLDVVGLPAIAISSASLFTKLVDNSMQGLGQGIQRGVLGVGTILGPLFAGPFIDRPIIILACTLSFIIIILVFVVIAFSKLKPKSTEIK